MGFRSYVRHFCGAISKLFRPSLPWGFAAGSGSLLGVAASHQQQQQEQQGFSVRHFCGAISKLFRLHCHGDLPLTFRQLAGEKSS